MPKLKTLAPDAPADEIIDLLNTEGALILRDVLTSAQVDRLNAELTPYVEATEPGRDAFSGNRTTRTGALVARSPATRDLIMHPAVLAGCDKFLLPNCERYQLHLAQVIRIMPGQGAQPIHRDRWAWGTWLKDIEPQFNTIWALSDFTKENGATQVCPGSLDWANDYKPKPEEIGYAEMSRGSVLIYSGSVFHGGGANVSNGDRSGLNITYALGWLRQEENQYLSCPPEIAKTLDPELAKLIGYTMGQYALGYYTPPLAPGEGPEVVDPLHALGHSVGDSMLGSTASLAAISQQILGENLAAE
jgi:ectoine hydroxylase-related dioxygenase (phytanoyl-CoA dioxygenase family)